MLVNIIIFGLALKNIVKRPSFGRDKLSRKTHSNLLKAMIKLFMSLGLTWLFGLLVLTDAGTAVQWIFTVFVSSQGVFIFLLQKAVFQQEVAKHGKDDIAGGTTSGIFSILLHQAQTKLTFNSLRHITSLEISHSKSLPKWLRSRQLFSRGSTTITTTELAMSHTASREVSDIPLAAFNNTATSTVRDSFLVTACQERLNVQINTRSETGTDEYLDCLNAGSTLTDFPKDPQNTNITDEQIVTGTAAPTSLTVKQLKHSNEILHHHKDESKNAVLLGTKSGLPEQVIHP